MTGTFRTDDLSHLLLPGIPADYLHTPILDPEHQRLLADRGVMLDVLKDEAPIPMTEAREGYFDDRHIEYWLSGRRDAAKVIAATGMHGQPLRVLDFGGGSGRVIRHFRQLLPGSELYLSDVNPGHISLTRQLFGGAIRALHNRGGMPSLPFADGYLDCVMAFSVFTHLDIDDSSWLLEMRRVIKPGGHLYITVHDQATWNVLSETVLGTVTLVNPEFKAYHESHPDLTGRHVHIYNQKADVYHCNVFVGRDYIDRFWAPLFSGYALAPLAHDHQSSLTFRV